MTQRLDQRNHVLDQHTLTIGIHVRRPPGVTVTPQVQGHRVVTGLDLRATGARKPNIPGKPCRHNTNGFSGSPASATRKIQTIGGKLPLTYKCHTLFPIAIQPVSIDNYLPDTTKVLLLAYPFDHCCDSAYAQKEQELSIVTAVSAPAIRNRSTGAGSTCEFDSMIHR